MKQRQRKQGFYKFRRHERWYMPDDKHPVRGSTMTIIAVNGVDRPAAKDFLWDDKHGYLRKK